MTRILCRAALRDSGQTNPGVELWGLQVQSHEVVPSSRLPTSSAAGAAAEDVHPLCILAPTSMRASLQLRGISAVQAL